MNMNVAIIGGTGNMGKLVTYLLAKHGFVVYPIGRKSPDFNAKIKKSEIVLFSIPFFAFDKTANKLKKFDLKNKLLVDLSSGVSRHLKKLESLSLNIAFIHLMFGPDIYNIKNQNVIVSDKIDDERFVELVNVFKKEGAHITISSPEHHDYMMAIVQALSQFNAISLAKTISNTKTNEKELEDFSSVTFSLNTKIISRILGQGPELWASIQFNNIFFKKILGEHLKNVKALVEYVRAKDHKRFNSMFENLLSFWKEKKQVEFLIKEKTRRSSIKKEPFGALGPEGSYSQQAALQYDARAKPIFFDSVTEIIEALNSGEIVRAVLPFENSIQGTVLETLDGIYQANLKITDEVIVNIKHVIAGLDKKNPAKEIKYIYSHPQALGQCGAYLKKYYPQAKLILTPSTSAAFKKIKDEGLTNTLAIGSKLAAYIYGLSIISDDIQDVKNNQTLFVVASKKPAKRKLAFTLFVINPRQDKPGLLHDILEIFKKISINLLKIESRPSKEKLGSYIFYFKAEIASNDKRMNFIVKELKKFGPVTLLT